MVYFRKKKHQKKTLNQLTDNLTYFFSGKNTNANSIGIENSDLHTKDLINNFERSRVDESNASQNQVIEKILPDKIRKEVDSIVMAVENRVHEAILTAMNNVVMPRVEKTVRSITESSGRRPSSMVQNLLRGTFQEQREHSAHVGPKSS